jgi:hypothetical protein
MPWLIGPDALWFTPYNGLWLRVPSENCFIAARTYWLHPNG